MNRGIHCIVPEKVYHTLVIFFNTERVANKSVTKIYLTICFTEPSLFIAICTLNGNGFGNITLVKIIVKRYLYTIYKISIQYLFLWIMKSASRNYNFNMSSFTEIFKFASFVTGILQ